MTPQNTISLTTQSENLFFGSNGHGLSRYDVVRYPQLLKLNEKMQSFYWRPVEVDMSAERASFNKMNDAERFVFTSNLRRQILLDSIQGRAPALAFLPHCTDPSLENCILTWGFFESIHSDSYTHIIRAIYPDPSHVFDEIPQIAQIADCATSIGRAYDTLQCSPSKEALYLALVAANALEALRFFVSFACTFSFAERGLVEGSAKVVKFIARDENAHLALVQTVLKLLPQDDPEFVTIAQDLQPQALAIFEEAADQEKQWVKYLFSKGAVLGLTEDILNRYIDYLLPRRLFAAGISRTRGAGDHPLPWVEKWYSNTSTQVAPQEVEIASYLTSSVVNDLNNMEFSL